VQQGKACWRSGDPLKQAAGGADNPRVIPPNPRKPPDVIQRFHLVLLGVTVTVLAVLLSSPRGLGRPPMPVHAAFGRGPTVVLIHGLGSRPEHWLPTARYLARSHRLVLVQLPGHGESAMPEPFSLDGAVQALDAVLEAETHGPVVLVGHSVGGLVATAEALEHPHRVSGLVLVETALRPQVSATERTELMAALDLDYRGLLRAAYTAFGRDSVQGLELYREVAALDSSAIKRWIRLALTADLSAEVARLHAPMLAVLAARSWPHGEPWRVTAAALGYTRVPALSRMRIEGCGHFVMLDRPAELAQAIEQFLAHPDGEPVAMR
jgi:pimeloyl-ACP methyl ester carboxylesterase